MLRFDRNGCLLAGLLILGTSACGGDDGGDGDSVGTGSDGGTEDGGNNGPIDDAGHAPLPVKRDAAVDPGDPPEELEGQQCAVDTNKLFDLIESDLQPAPTQLAVDPNDSRFGLSFAGQSDACVDAVYFAAMQGSGGKPEVSTVIDECTAVTAAAITHTGQSWLIASVDNRMDTVDLWVQTYDGEEVGEAYRLSETTAREQEVALAVVGDERVMAAWVEKDLDSGVQRLIARPLSFSGEPTGDAVVLEESDTAAFAGLSLSRVGVPYAGLGYRRSDDEGSSIVFDILSTATGERDRDSWVLTDQGGVYGSIDIAADDFGGAVLYSLVQGNSRQLWVQRIGNDGRAARLMTGALLGGPASAERVVGPPFNATDGSITKLAIGYAVASRSLPGGSVESPRIRVHFLESSGRLTGNSDVALASEFGGRTAIETAIDGRVVLGWSDVLEDGTTALTAVKLPCVGGP